MRAAGRLISFGRVSHQTDVPTTRTASRTTKRRLFLRLPGEGWTSLSDRTPRLSTELSICPRQNCAAQGSVLIWCRVEPMARWIGAQRRRYTQIRTPPETHKPRENEMETACFGCPVGSLFPDRNSRLANRPLVLCFASFPYSAVRASKSCRTAFHHQNCRQWLRLGVWGKEPTQIL